jgi:hypothetical protein
MTPKLTPDETATARELWHELQTGAPEAPEAREHFADAPENIQEAILEATPQVVAGDDAPNAEKPFEAI